MHPKGISPIPRACPERYGEAARALSAIAIRRAHCAAPLAMSVSLRNSGAVRTKFHNRSQYGAANEKDVQSIHLSASAHVFASGAQNGAAPYCLVRYRTMAFD